MFLYFVLAVFNKIKMKLKSHLFFAYEMATFALPYCIFYGSLMQDI